MGNYARLQHHMGNYIRLQHHIRNYTRLQHHMGGHTCSYPSRQTTRATPSPSKRQPGMANRRHPQQESLPQQQKLPLF
ncbi:hypothetical protein BDR07DRAFT_1440968 [Suillus spraguei]|nr:hypothetical protein BDR07DRAFT_1440968 [Suillus spraguei]